MPKVMMISGVSGGGDIGARGRVPVAGAYRSPIGRLIGHANLGAVHEGSADAIRAGLMLPLLRGAGIGAMRSLNYPSAGLRYPSAALRGVGLGTAAQDRQIATSIAAGARTLCLSFCGLGAGGGKTQSELIACQTVCNAAYTAATTGIDIGYRDPDPTTGDPTADYVWRRQQQLEDERRAADGDFFDQGYQNYNAPPPAPAAAGVPNWVYYAGAAAGIGLLAYAVLGGKRRR